MGIGWTFKSFDRARWDATFGNRAPGVEQKIVDAMLCWEEGYFDPDSDELRPGYDRDKILASAQGKAARELASHLVYKGFTYDGLGEDQSVELDDFGSRMWSPEGLADALDAKLLSDGWLSPRAVTELLFRAGQFQALQYQGDPPTIASGATEEAVHAAWMAQRREMRRPASLAHTPVRLLKLLDWGVASQHSPDIARLLQRLGLGETSPRSRAPARLVRRLLDWGSPRVRTAGRRFGTEAEPTRGNSGFYVIFSPPELVELREEVEAAINMPMPWTAPEWLPGEVQQSLVVPLNKTTKAGLWGAMTYSS
jgi:hypothetical protein